ncbi:FIMAH domain-containing protein [uncultured Trichococcus sp.]|uniref:FIMAH domain-containing protein n=1 Tax=uncultured Trichococcus sp. TaxID=189665 RepID=UPI002A18A708|nr:hypothetical protein [uncultured Trichococcus sp.]
MKRNMIGKFSSIFISVLFLCMMFIASSTGDKAYASEYVDVATDVGFNIADLGVDGSGHVYAIDSDTGNIMKMDSDGTNRVVLGTVESAQRIAVDDVNQYIYITNGTGVVQRMNFDGTEVIDFLTLVNTIRCVTVDDSGRVYVGESGVGIVRIEQDGTGSSLIRSVSSGAGSVVSIAVNDVNGYVYYIQQAKYGGNRTLNRLNIDGSGDPVKIGSTSPSLKDVTVDTNGYAYYSLMDRVYRVGTGSIYEGILGVQIAADENGCVYASSGTVLHKIMTIDQLMAETRESIAKHIDNGNIVDIGSSLISKFGNFATNFGLENNTAALNQLDAFMNEVSAQRGNKIVLDVADALIARSQTLHNIMTGEQNTVERIVALKELIAEYLDYGEIEANTAARLVSKLDNCSASLDKEDNTAAANQLNAFINEVSAQSGNKISEYVADELIATAQVLLEINETPVESEETMTSEEVPLVTEESEYLETIPTEESQTNEEPTIIEEANEANPQVSEETEATEVPKMFEELATIEASAVEEESEVSEITSTEELQTSQETTIIEEAAEANLPVDEEAELTEVPKIAETPIEVEETQP